MVSAWEPTRSAARDRGPGCGRHALRPRGEWARTALIALAPYAAWILIAQNLRYEPRHALPLVAVIAFYLGLALAYAPLRCAALVLCMGAIAWRDGRLGRAVLPAGAQLAAFVEKIVRREDTVVYGGRGVRFLELDRMHRGPWDG